MPTRSPARLVVALAVAGVLAIFLLYTAVAGHSTPTLTPSEIQGKSGKLQVVGTVVGKLHGDSHGALTVVRGALTEDRWSPERAALRTRTLTDGRSVGFGHGYVHEVSNPAAEPAVSVHAYSPPLTEMSYYALDPRPDGAGSQLRRTSTAYTGPGSSEGVG